MRAEADVERANRRVVAAEHEDDAGHAEDDVEDVVARRAARRRLVGRDHEAEDADDDEDRREDRDRQRVHGAPIDGPEFAASGIRNAATVTDQPSRYISVRARVPELVIHLVGIDSCAAKARTVRHPAFA